MKISILTVFPELYSAFIDTSLIQRAQEKGMIEFDIKPFFDFVKPKERIDAPPFGPGAGMMIRPEVVEKGVESLEKSYGPAFKIFFSPHGQQLDQPLLQHIAQKAQEKGHLMLLPARYEGMDARVEEQYADLIVSVGDFVLMGGDIPAMMVLEGTLRLIPGVVGKEESVKEESFSGPFVDYPGYTEPVTWKGKKVPEILRSGNHAAIAQWRQQEAAYRTVRHHFDWLRSCPLTHQQKEVAKQFIPRHYVALLHHDVLVGPTRSLGTTSVTSIDIHDIARSASTFGIQNFFLATPLQDQQVIVKKLLDFWLHEQGPTYNPNRHEALKSVLVCDYLADAIAHIEQKEGKKPLLIATSAWETDKNKAISYYDQSRIWQENRPVLFIFGTGQGLSPVVLDQSDYILLPVHGFSDFNHLSVRSAVATILDRWMGINERILL
jgi:tRNA (guanine37-N1)-methyltransferase